MRANHSLRPALLSTAGLACLAGLALHASPSTVGARAGLAFSTSTLVVGGAPQRVQAAEFDGDGDTDLVLLSASSAGSTLASWRNEGALGFALHWQKTLPALGNGTLPDLDVGDLDGDGALDLVHCVPHGSHQAHVNAGDGSFPSSFGIFSAGGRTTHSLADLDADGTLDLAYHDFDFSGYIGAQVGQGNGAFTPTFLEITGGPSTFLVSSALCDGNGDGQPDFVLASSSGLRLVLGTLASGLPAWQGTVLLLSGTYREVEAADLDGDGLVDLVASQPTLDRLCVLRALPGGNFAPPEFVAFGLQPESVAIADLDGDGLLDLAASSSRRGGRVYVRLAVPGGGYAPLWQTTVGRSAVDLSPGDLDGDGDVDLVVADALLGRLVLLENQLLP